MSDFLTVLTAHSSQQLTKGFNADGSTSNVDFAKHFRVSIIDVADIHELDRHIKSLLPAVNSCVIRGYRAPAPRGIQRLKENFEDRPHHWACFDVDDFYSSFYDDVTKDPEAIIDEFVTTQLPQEFHDVSFSWQLSSSAGVYSKEKLKAHIWFWLKTPYNSSAMHEWVTQERINVDKALFRTVQVHYTAAPVFNGMADPALKRAGFCSKKSDEVHLTIDPLIIVDAEVRAETSTRELVDPKSKVGLIGEFHKRFTVEHVMEVFIPGEFEYERADNNSRLTWTKGNGKGGARITDDRLHIFVTNNTFRESNKALNLYDIVRVCKFGELDDDALNFVPNTGLHSPSQLAMREFAAEVLGLSADDLKKKDSVEALTTYLSTLEETADLIEGQQLITKVASEHLLTDIELDTFIKKFTKKFGVGTKGVRDQIKKETKRSSGKLVFPKVTGEGRPTCTIENIVAMLDHLGWKVRYNVITKDIEVDYTHGDISNETASSDNRLNVAMASIRSKLNEFCINGAGTEQLLLSIADMNRINPVKSWLDSITWDGKSRLQQYYDCFDTSDAKIEPAMKYTLMRKWALQCVALGTMEDTDEHVSAAGVLVVQGGQGIGKTRFLHTLVPSNLLLLGRHIDPANKDSVQTAISYWIVELGELDSTFRKSDISALKAFLTNSSDRFRRPYAMTDSKYPRRTSFYASVNPDSFLHDTTGNRRYYTIPVEKIDLEHTMDRDQFWAEIYQLHKNGEQFWLDEDEKSMLEDHNTRFESRGLLVEEFLPRMANCVTCGDVTTSVIEYVKEYARGGKAVNKLDVQELEGALIKKGYKYELVDGIKMFRLPVLSNTGYEFKHVRDSQ